MNKYKNIDIFDEEDWNETELDGSFLCWLKKKYPNKGDWKYLLTIDCSNNNLINLNGIEKLHHLIQLNCSNNLLKNLNGIEKLDIIQLNCTNNKLIDLNEIKKCTNLIILQCNNNNLINLNGIENLTKLRYLDCYNNQLININEIKNLISKIQYIKCDYEEIHTLSKLYLKLF
jgi:Leucine-rich repeat (LRR) protein